MGAQDSRAGGVWSSRRQTEGRPRRIQARRPARRATHGRRRADRAVRCPGAGPGAGVRV